MVKWVKENIIGMVCMALFLALNLIWIFRDNTYPFWDESDYLAKSFSLWATLQQGHVWQFFMETIKVSSVKPALISLLPFPFYYLFGVSIRHALIAISTCMAIFNLLFYLFLDRTYGKKTAIFGLLIINTFPIFAGLSRTYFIEMPLLLITFLFFICLRTSEGLRKNKIALVVLLAAGLLLKVSFILYIAGLLFYEGYHYRERLQEYGIKLLKILAITAGIVFIWYVPNLLSLLKFVLCVFAKSPGDIYDPDLQNSHVPLAYVPNFVNEGCGLFYFLLALLLAALWLWQARPIWNKLKTDNVFMAALFNAAFINLFVMFFLKYKSPRYAFPSCSFLVIALVVVMKTLAESTPPASRWFRYFRWLYPGTLVLIALSFLQFINSSFNVIQLPQWTIGKYEIFAQHLPVTYRCRNFKYPIMEILSAVKNRHPGSHPKVVFLFDSRHMNQFNTQMVSNLHAYGLTVDTLIYNFEPDPEKLLPAIRAHDYVFMSPEQTEPVYTNHFNRPRYEYYIRKEYLKKIGTWDAPDGKKIKVYANARRLDIDLRSEYRKKFDYWYDKLLHVFGN